MATVNLHCEKNNEDHRTSEISTKRLIVRRGQPFLLTLHSSSAQSPNPESLELTVQTGPEPSEDFGTKSVIGVSRKNQSKKPWLAKVHETSATSVSLHITSPADASIGQYTLSVKTHPDMTKGILCNSAASFVLLFNPWCTEDSVHLANEAERQEYVLNEQGRLYRGLSQHITGLDWDFGQFEEDIIDICMKLLDLNPKCLANAAKDVSKRCSPIYVSRVISAMINCEDDRGVLEGKWSGSYTDGVFPSRWDGSVDILRKWRDSDYKPVKYGQCWVFAAVMCGVIRCLGIPCRPVTNFDCACDSHGNLTIDEYFTDVGFKPMESKDSLWNFHVWVEAWMRRPDLPGGSFYDGWQVLDPTPQELSDGVYCCGPAPVKAILEGHMDMKYDLPFIFAEVNADWVAWRVKEDGSYRRYITDTKRVGQKISTKSVGSDELQDITANYKYPEGTAKERKVFKEALRRTKMLKERENTPAVPPPKISMKIKEQSKPMNGKDIDLVIVLQSPEPRNVELHINAQAMLYNGKLESYISSEEKQVQLLANEELTVPFQIPFSKYGSHIQGNNSIKVTVEAIDQENSEEEYLAEKNIVPDDPPFTITIHGDPVQFKYVHAEINFDNPLDEPLNDVSITVTCSGFLDGPVETKFSSVGAGHQARVMLVFAPHKAGARKLIATLDCDKFQNIQCCLKINVAHSFPNFF